MRIALTAALMIVAAIAWGEDSSSSETKAETSVEATQAQPVESTSATEPATEQTTEQTAPATATTMEQDKPFKIPAGYREKRVNGKVMYCSSRVTSGSRFGKDTCRTEEQLRALERQKEAARSESNQ